MELLLSKLQDANPRKKEKIIKKIVENVDFSMSVGFFAMTFCSFTVVLPPTTHLSAEFRAHIERVLFDDDMRSDLEHGKIINWCRTAQILFPLNTTKDGNCLLHSISQYIWGIEDSNLILRRLLFSTLQNDCRDIFKRRYFYFMKDRNSDLYGGLLQFDSMEMTREWDGIVNNAEPKQNANFADPHTFLEPIHIYVMANILKRPIIVMAEARIRTFGDAVSLQENDISGIYLPLDIPPGDCIKYPIVLGFSMNHFCPLVRTHVDSQSNRKPSIPLQKHDLSMLPLKFLYPAEERKISTLISSYLTLVDLLHKDPISAAKLGNDTLSEDLNLVPDYIRDCEEKYQRFINADVHGPLGVFNQTHKLNIPPSPVNPGPNIPVQSSKTQQAPPSMSVFQTRPCVTPGCDHYGSANTGNMCSECFNQYTKDHCGPPISIFFNELEPTAPPNSRPFQSLNQVPVSFVNQKCQTPGCVYHCSNQTYPLCHDCKEKNVRSEENSKRKQNLTVNIQQQPGTQQRSPQTEEMLNLSAKLEHNVHPLIQPSRSQSRDHSEAELFGSGTSQQTKVEKNNFTSDYQITTHPRQEAEVVPMDTSPRQPPITGLQKTKCLTTGCNDFCRSLSGLCPRCFVVSGVPDLQHSTNQIPPNQTSNQILSSEGLTNQVSSNQVSSNQIPSDSGATNNISSNHRTTNQTPRSTPGSTNQIYSSKAVTNQQQGSEYRSEHTAKPSSPAHKSKHFCSTPGCSGIRQLNESGVCSTCYIQASPHRISEPAPKEGSNQGLSEIVARQGSIEDNLDVSETPSEAIIEPPQTSCMDDDSVKCANPLCANRIYPPSKMCQVCLDVLRRHQSPLKYPKVSKSQPCKNRSCEFHGTPEMMGYCSACYKKAQEGNKNVLTTSTNSAPISRQNRYPVETPSPRSQTAPISRKGKKCIIEGCDFFGDPNFDNMCTRCYNINRPKTAEISRQQGFFCAGEQQRIPLQEASLIHGGSHFVSNSFERSALLLEQSRKEQTLCKRAGCDNYGHQRNEGFCNECYKKYYKPAFERQLERVG